MFSIPCSVFAAATFSPAGFAVQIFSSEMGLYCARMFSSRCSSLSLIHLPLEPHVSFKSPLLSSPLFSFCSLALSKLQHSSLLPFHLSLLSTVCTQKREKIFLNLQMWKKVSHRVECTTPRRQFRDESCCNSDGISFIYLLLQKSW